MNYKVISKMSSLLKNRFTLARRKRYDIKIYNNTTNRLIDDLKQEVRQHSKLKIAVTSFSIYTYEALKEELEEIDELQFLFTSNLFTEEQEPKEKQEFFIPRVSHERKLYGDDFELKIRNKSSQKVNVIEQFRVISPDTKVKVI